MQVELIWIEVLLLLYTSDSFEHRTFTLTRCLATHKCGLLLLVNIARQTIKLIDAAEQIYFFVFFYMLGRLWIFNKGSLRLVSIKPIWKLNLVVVYLLRRSSAELGNGRLLSCDVFGF